MAAQAHIQMSVICVEQGCSKNLRQPGNEHFEPGKINELYHKSGANFIFCFAIVSRVELLNGPDNLPITRLLSASLLPMSD